MALKACRNQDARTAVSSSSKEGEYHFWFDQHKNRELFVQMVIDKKIKLKHVENPLFEEFARSLQPMYNHVNRMTVEEDCLTFYENEKAK